MVNNNSLTNFTPPSYNTILQSMINTYQQAATYFGYNVNITPTDEIFVRLSTNSTVMAVLYQYGVQLVNSKLLYSATGTNLDIVGNALGFIRRTALSSQGAVALVSSAPQTFLTGTLLNGPNGYTFQVQTTGVYANGQNVNIISVDQGSQTNIPTGSIMTWQTPTGTMQSTALVSVACQGGVDAEQDESYRSRIYLSVQAPPGMGNATQIITTSASVDNIIQQAFTYANFNGVGTQLIALVGYQTSSYVGRDIPHLPYDGYVSIYGNTVFNPSLVSQTGGFGAFNQYTLPANNSGPNLSNDTQSIMGQLSVTVANPFATTITTINNVPSDIAAVLTLPYPVGAQPNGLGGGWLQATPWPVPDGYFVQKYCSVASVTSSTVITITAPSSINASNPNVSSQVYLTQVPTVGQTQVQWINRSDANLQGWQVITATVIAATDNGNNTWTITLDTPLVYAPGAEDFYGNTTGVVVGDLISPAAANTQTYVNNILSSYALLGPGEVTSNQGLLAVGAARYPSSNTVWNESIGAPAEKVLELNNEVFNAELNPGNGVIVNGITFYNCYNSANAAPSNNAPPNIWVPRYLAFYPSEYYNFGE